MCVVCRAKRQSAADRRRGSSAARGYGARWQRYRISYLLRHPACEQCRLEGRLVAAEVIDHIIPHRGDESLMWDEANHQALCKACHDRKTAREDGGFGRR